MKMLHRENTLLEEYPIMMYYSSLYFLIPLNLTFKRIELSFLHKLGMLEYHGLDKYIIYLDWKLAQR